nr:putative nuclease HARBI1 [Rhipicephalus microplus]
MAFPTDMEFRQCFRLSKQTVRSLCDELDPIIRCQRASGLSTETKVLCALRFFATGSGYYTLNVMIVCNARLRILVVDPRFPGSCHDSWVWEHNPLRSRLAAQLQPGEYLLGDAGYPLEPWLLVPVPGSHPGNTSEGRFNKEHASMRNIVERCIGVLKSKFRCLQHFRTMLYNPDRAGRIIYACAALHNIASDAGDWTLDEYVGDMPPVEDDDKEPGESLVLTPRNVQQQRSAVVGLF